MVRCSRPALAVLVLVIGAASWGAPRSAIACTLDNKPSLVANGIHAKRNPIAPTGVGKWAPFVISTPFASGAVVRLTELRASLVRTLSAAALAAPFRWTLGDGTIAFGHVVNHRYARPDLYQVAVYALDTHAHVWFPFDRVLLRIGHLGTVPISRYPSAIHAGQAGTPSMSELAFAGAILIVGLVRTVMLLRRRRHTTPWHRTTLSSP